MESAVTLLPEPDSPTTPEGLAGLDGVVDAVHRLGGPVVRVEVGLEPLDAEEVLAVVIGSRHQTFILGSMASRIASPTRL